MGGGGEGLREEPSRTSKGDAAFRMARLTNQTETPKRNGCLNEEALREGGPREGRERGEKDYLRGALPIWFRGGRMCTSYKKNCFKMTAVGARLSG